MHGKSIAWVRDRCTLEGAMRPLLYAVATHADRHYAVCNASAATLARASGVSTRWVKTLLREAVDIGVLEQLYEGRGRKPAAYRIAPPLWVEGTVTASAVVEGTVTASGVVEGEISTGPASGEPSSPQRSLEVALGLRSGALLDPVVVHFSDRSGALLPALSSADGPQEKYVEEKNIEDKNVPHPRSLAGARSDAGQAQAPDAMESPPVPESVKRELERRGLRLPTGTSRPKSTSPPPRSRDEQLAALKRMEAEEEAEKAKSAKSGEASA
jgi:tryptophan 2,3-dioxygenase